MWAGGHVGRWAAPPSFHAVRAARRWIRFSVVPSIWGRRVWIQPWAVLDYSARVIYGPDQQIDKISSLSSSLSSPPWHRNTCSRRGRDRVAILLQPRPTRSAHSAHRPISVLCHAWPDTILTASENEECVALPCLLTGNFPSTINTPATTMLVLMHISRQISRPLHSLPC